LLSLERKLLLLEGQKLSLELILPSCMAALMVA